ncbi:hypothetical protein [Desulforamulus aquiferis]|uniref:SipL SPOCS domain-containing protein n=1 Tax=Desulforamulus aquiferis TaxID=1397668 RepID=A0AAW7ZG45_9FIRM|nr:hypothetical protein [Desulforamulus aquiferis]MDO7788678.1 hypothetical protein [Desulforamulus aquiferis]RYD05334.1 hypothetical protein N752_09825 [Desulforamulus aquiferis]
MAFVNQVSTTNFVPQKLKVLKVLCQDCFQEMGTTAFPGLAVGIDLPVADLDLLVFDVEAGIPTVPNITVLPNKVLNTISVPLTVTVTLLGVEVLTLDIPGFFITGEIVCSGIVPDGTVNVQKHDLQVLEPIVPVVADFTVVDGLITELTLLITVIVEGCAVISREEILKVNAASLFCPCP